MAQPQCPPHYVCTFTPKDPKHYFDHWWDTVWGLVAVVAVLITLCIIAAILFDYVKWRSMQKIERENKREVRAHRFAMMEQLTVQVDAAQGDPEMLALIREQQKKLNA